MKDKYGILAGVAMMALAYPMVAVANEAEAGDAGDILLVIGKKGDLVDIPGSGSLIDQTDLERSHVFSTNEALRKVPGLIVRDEEGIGLRPNIGIRGLNPTRSGKVLLLEDGVPVTFAPYGDNTTYYHPPVERFERIEVLKGASQIGYGPQSVGGVINYITPAPPEEMGGKLTIKGGSRDYFDMFGSAGGTVDDTGFIVNALYKQADGARDNLHSEVFDLSGKIVQQFGDNHKLTLRGSYYDEDSQQTYSGLTTAEYLADPRSNPFKNDAFTVKRWAASLTHAWDVTDNFDVATTAYFSDVQRNWWRQSSNSAQRPNDSSDPACGGMVNLNTTCGNEGRLRGYQVYGLESRARWEMAMGEVDFGVRIHRETQRRIQANGDTPYSRTAGVRIGSNNSGIVENQKRAINAYSAFLQPRIDVGQLSFTPGIRVEHIRYSRTNLPTVTSGAITKGKESLTEWIPGIGLNWKPTESMNIFAGVHRGFSPPVTSDIINGSGLSLPLDPERSWNWELGVRAAPTSGIDLEATLFRLDFSNQVIPASVAGGAGATVTNGGKTLHQGLEVGANFHGDRIWPSASVQPYGRLAWTWVAKAKFNGLRCVARINPLTGASDTTSPAGAGCSALGSYNVDGNRLPYAPEHAVTAMAGLNFVDIGSIEVEYVRVSSQWADDQHTIGTAGLGFTTNGQRGRIPAYGVWNLSANVPVTIGSVDAKLFMTVKNLTNKLYVVDLTRGIMPGMPRLWQGGVSFDF